jgi:hypothetical protein
MAGGDFKLSTKMGIFEPYGRIGYYAKPLKSAFVFEQRNSFGEIRNIFRVESPKTMTSMGLGSDFAIDKNKKITAGFNYIYSDKDIEDLDKDLKQGPYNRMRFNVGYKQKLELSRRAGINTYAGIFMDNTNIGGYGYRKLGGEIGIGYEHALTKRISINANAILSYGRASMPNDLTEFSRLTAEGGTNTEMFANIGLHYNVPLPRFDVPDLDWGFDKPQRRVKQPKRKTVKSNVPCYAYPRNKVSQTNDIFNKP